MTIEEYNDKLSLVSEKGDLSLTGRLYKLYEDEFWEWYGEPTFEDIFCTKYFPESDFEEWVKSRTIDFEVILEEWADISPFDIEVEYQSVINKIS